MYKRIFTPIAIAFFAIPALVPAGQPNNIADTSLDDLMNMQVTSLSKKEQSLSKAGGSIFVITQDDIRHSGATDIPDLLRMVPGVQVARLDANTVALSIRGFNQRYSSKVLALIDGRTIYTPGFSGVFWDQEFVPLENIERIEVIRGPGGTVWGANAMNGVINIITKSSESTRGLTVSNAVGSTLRDQSLVQYGGSAGAAGTYRIYGRYSSHNDSRSALGNPAMDGGHNLETGFRSDWSLSGQNKVTVQGDLLGVSDGQRITTLFNNSLPRTATFEDAVRVGSGNILARWDHVFANGSQTTAQIYYDRYRRWDQSLNIEHTGDVDVQYHFRLGSRNDIVAGTGYRITDQIYVDGYEVSMGTGHRRDNLPTAFIQDEFSLSNSLALTAGIKIGHNGITGLEYQPGAQLVWTADSHNTVWASVARAIQQPSWTNSAAVMNLAAIHIPGVPYALIRLSGDPTVQAPALLDYEVGYRTRPSKRMSFDTTFFVGQYRALTTTEPQAPYFESSPSPAHLVIPSVFGDRGRAFNYGTEASAHVNVATWWRLSPGFSYLESNVWTERGSMDDTFYRSGADTPKFQGSLISSVNFSHGIEWDTSAYYVGSLPGAIGAMSPVPAYTRLDTRLGWHFSESSEISIVGQNLLSPGHLEFTDGYQVSPTESARAVVARITLRH